MPTLLDIAGRCTVSRCLHVVADLGLADALDGAPWTGRHAPRRAGIELDLVERVFYTQGMLAGGSFEEVQAGASPLFHLVLPRDKRDRLARRLHGLQPSRSCAARGCTAEGLCVVLVDAEKEAVLCPFHQLVGLDGRPVEGEPMVVAAGW
jgi:hypothetical protein